MPFRKTLLAAIAAALLTPVSVAAAQTPARPLGVEQIFGSDAVQAEHAGASRWTEDGRAYTIVEPSKDVDGGDDIVRYDIATDARRLLVSARDLIPEGAEQPLDVQNYS